MKKSQSRPARSVYAARKLIEAMVAILLVLADYQRDAWHQCTFLNFVFFELREAAGKFGNRACKKLDEAHRIF